MLFEEHQVSRKHFLMEVTIRSTALNYLIFSKSILHMLKHLFLNVHKEQILLYIVSTGLGRLFVVWREFLSLKRVFNANINLVERFKMIALESFLDAGLLAQRTQ